jgi:hypothetical protein
LKAKLETPYVVSCFFNRLLAAAGGDSGVFAKLAASVSAGSGAAGVTHQTGKNMRYFPPKDISE